MHAFFFKYLSGVGLALILVGTAAAQSLAGLLPAETFLALGTQDLAQYEAKLDPFIAEFERLELGSALLELFPADAAEQEGLLDEVASPFEGLNLYDMLGQEAWIAVSAASFNPLPALTLLTRLSPEASGRAATALAEAAGRPGTESLSEGAYTFYVETLDNGDEFIQVLAYAQTDDLLMVSTNPNVLRGVLRHVGGSSDPSFASSESYASSLGQLAPGSFYGYLDFAQVASVAAPFAQGFGFDQLVTRLLEAFSTAGVSAGTVRLSDAGLESESLQALDPNGGDTSLYELLTSGASVDPAAARLAPEGALSWASSSTDLGAWWDYLNELAGSTPELGGDLDYYLSAFLGIDLRSSLFSWLGDRLTTVTTGLGEVAEPGMPSSNLLGDSVYILEVSDEAAAQTGLSSLMATLGTTVASFTDPSGGPGNASTQQLDIAGVEVTTLSVSEGLSLSYAVSDSQAYIGTSEAALEAVLSARGAASLADSEAFDRLSASAPEGASSLSISNNRATLAGTAQQITSQLQITAGLGGASNLDFEAVEAASEKLQNYLEFVAERLGYSTGFSVRRGDSLYSYSQSDIAW